MKLFKKLMAVALAGAMALTLLTGCASSVNQKELVNYLNDLCGKYGDSEIQSIEQGDSALAQKVLNGAAKYAENHESKYYKDALVVWEYFDDEYDSIAKEIVPKDTKDAYYLGYTLVEKYQSKDIQSMKTMLLAENLRESLQPLNTLSEEDRAKLSDKATVSIATKEIGGETWLVAVFVQKAK